MSFFLLHIKRDVLTFSIVENGTLGHYADTDV